LLRAVQGTDATGPFFWPVMVAIFNTTGPGTIYLYVDAIAFGG
jgi:hypothetical protein